MFTALLPLLTAASAVPPAPDDADALAFQAQMERMAAVIADMKDCTFTFRSQEYIGGSMTDWSVAEVKFRVETDVYMKFTEGPNAGRELLYRGESWNGGRMKVDPGRFLPVLNLHPEGRLARRGNRHTIRDLPLPVLGAKVLADAVKVRDHATWTPDVVDLGSEPIGGRPARCFDSTLPKDEDPTLYAHKVRICLDEATGLPARMRIHDREDGAIRLVEAYDYEQLKVDSGLSDADFDPATYGL